MTHQGTLELETLHLRLRRFQPGDLESCLENWAADERVFRFISPAPRSRTYMEEFLAGADEAYANPATYYWAIEKRDQPGVIGEIFVDDFSERNRWCEISYKLGSGFWGRGFAAEALRAVTAYLFDQVGFHRVQAKCAARNTASERVMQKAGMHREGILREYFRCKNGPGYEDVALYAILNPSVQRVG